MIFFDGTYRLRTGLQGGLRLRKPSAGAWRVRIINLSLSQPGIRHLRPFIVYINPEEVGIFKTTCAESMGKRIFRDFSLNVSETLWLELLPHPSEKIYAAVFAPTFSYGPEQFYNIAWRPLRHNELVALKAFIPEISGLNETVLS